MTKFLLGRLGGALVAIFGVVTIVFFITRLLGDPVALLLPPEASAEQMQALRSQLGLDLPLWRQYLDFIYDVVSGDLGMSFQHNRPAMTVILERMPATMLLAFSGVVLGLFFGGIAGMLAAIRRGRISEFAIMLVALIGQATPSFWLGLMLILFFSVRLGWLPTGGYETWSAMVLPVLTVGFTTSAAVARLYRSSLLEVLREDYVRTARAKGMRPATVLSWHVARNALIPVVTMAGILVGELLGGSVIIETIFAWPGVGRLIIQAVENKDFPVIQAGVILVAFIFVVVNLFVDLLYGVLDPRIRLRQGI